MRGRGSRIGGRKAAAVRAACMPIYAVGMEWPLHVCRRRCPLLAAPNRHADDPLVGSIAQQYMADREGHDKTAAEWTKRYAQG